MEAYGITRNVLVSAGSGNGGTHSGIVDSEGHGQSVGCCGNICTLVQCDIVNEEVILVIVKMVESDIDALTSILGQINSLHCPSAGRSTVSTQNGGESSCVVSCSREHHTVFVGIGGTSDIKPGEANAVGCAWKNEFGRNQPSIGMHSVVVVPTPGRGNVSAAVRIDSGNACTVISIPGLAVAAAVDGGPATEVVLEAFIVRQNSNIGAGSHYIDIDHKRTVGSRADSLYTESIVGSIG